MTAGAGGYRAGFEPVKPRDGAGLALEPFGAEPQGGGTRDMSREDTTRLLLKIQKGDANAAESLVPLIYDDLRALAARYMRNEPADHTLQPTALVHEAFLRLVDTERVEWRTRAHFMAVAARTMRRILVDHARRRRAIKRGGGKKVTLVEGMAFHEQRPLDLVALDDALAALAGIDERQSSVVELRFFGGLGVEEIAEVLDVSTATVKRDWRFARAWLLKELSAQE
jgi:RNA polymerase sigma factor (TIGR02999 family)